MFGIGVSGAVRLGKTDVDVHPLVPLVVLCPDFLQLVGIVLEDDAVELQNAVHIVVPDFRRLLRAVALPVVEFIRHARLNGENDTVGDDLRHVNDLILLGRGVFFPVAPDLGGIVGENPLVGTLIGILSEDGEKISALKIDLDVLGLILVRIRVDEIDGSARRKHVALVVGMAFLQIVLDFDDVLAEAELVFPALPASPAPPML